MNSIEKQLFLSRLITALIVIGVFVENASTSVQYDPLDAINNLGGLDDNGRPDYSVFHKAASLSKSLATRNRTKIGDVLDALMTEDELELEIDSLYSDRLGSVERTLDRYNKSLKNRLQSANNFTTHNKVLLNSTFGQTLRNDSANQLNAQIIRHQLIAPMNLIHSLYSFPLAQHSQTQTEKQLLSQAIEQLKYKFRSFKEVLHDFEFILRGTSELTHIKDAIAKLTKKLNGLLKNVRVVSLIATKSMFKEWKTLANIIADARPQDSTTTQILNRMKNLMKCSELSAVAYRGGRNNATKLTIYSQHVDKFQNQLQKWKDYEQTIYGIGIPTLQKIEEALESIWETKLDSLIQSILPKFDNILGEMQRQPLYGNDLYRVFEDTKQLTRVIKSFLNYNQTFTDRSALVTLMKQIRKIGSNIPKEMHTLNGIITANLALELCMTTREVLKMRVIPFDQDYLELCNMPPIRDPSQSKEHVKKNLLKNIKDLKSKIAYHKSIMRKQDEVTITANMSRFSYYQWSSKDFKNDITKLLKGEKIILTADASTSQRNTMKFSRILLDFIFPNASRQTEFYKAIKGYMVNLKLIGNNYYRCDNRLYYVPTDADLELQYTLGENNTVASGNPLYEDLIQRDAYLSLYSTWEIQLDNPFSAPGKTDGFIGDQIDLQFRGTFQYVLNEGYGQQACSNYALNNNYQLDRILKM